MIEWVDIIKLPNYDEYVLFLFESGAIIHECLNKDDTDLKFLKGSKFSGRITHWAKVNYPS